VSSLTSKDRVSLCLFSFTDGRRCRTPRTGNHPHFCFYHAQKEARAQAADKLAKDLACFFSGDYLSACDLSTAMARLIPAVIRGDIKPRLARTVAYMVQTQLQAINLSQHEYINAFGTDGWRKAVRNSVNVNYDYRFPPNPAPEPSEGPQSHPAQPHAPLAPQPLPAAAQPSPSMNQPTTQTLQPQNPPAATSPQLPNTPTRDPYTVHFDHNYRLRPSP
jgi:hypothetical protein